MDGYFIHLNASTLNVGLYNGNQNPKFITEDLLPTAVSRSRVIDPQEFCKELSKILATHYGEKLPRLPLYFILEPELTELFLLTGSKNGVGPADESEHMEKQIRERLVDEEPKNLYLAQYKIAPFIYQSVGIKKDLLDPFLESGNTIGLEIGGILPLGLILAKTNTDVSSMFVFPGEKEVTAVFSELTGVTFAEKFGGKLAVEELIELFWKLSVYNSKHGEVKMYTFSKYEHNLGSHSHSTLGDGTLEDGFEEIDLTHRTLENTPTILNSLANLINILPVQEMPRKNKAPVIALATITSFLLVAGLMIQLTVGFDTLLGKQTSNQQQEVLAGQEQTTATATPEPIQQEGKKEIKRTDITLRVENGNGVAGSARKLKTYLEGFGYKVISVGNADKTDYTQTSIKLPKDLANYKDLLTNDLKTNYSVEIVDVDTKPADYDVLIIAGAK